MSEVVEYMSSGDSSEDNSLSSVSSEELEEEEEGRIPKISVVPLEKLQGNLSEDRDLNGGGDQVALGLACLNEKLPQSESESEMADLKNRRGGGGGGEKGLPLKIPIRCDGGGGGEGARRLKVVPRGQVEGPRSKVIPEADRKGAINYERSRSIGGGRDCSGRVAVSSGNRQKKIIYAPSSSSQINRITSSQQHNPVQQKFQQSGTNATRRITDKFNISLRNVDIDHGLNYTHPPAVGSACNLLKRNFVRTFPRDSIGHGAVVGFDPESVLDNPFEGAASSSKDAAITQSSAPLGRRIRRPRLEKPLKMCSEIMMEILAKKNKEWNWPFYKADYKGILGVGTGHVFADPIYLNQIKAHLSERKYSRPEEFARDMKRLLNNFFNYYEPTEPFYKHAERLQQVFEREYKKIKDLGSTQTSASGKKCQQPANLSLETAFGKEVAHAIVKLQLAQTSSSGSGQEQTVSVQQSGSNTDRSCVAKDKSSSSSTTTKHPRKDSSSHANLDIHEILELLDGHESSNSKPCTPVKQLSTIVCTHQKQGSSSKPSQMQGGVNAGVGQDPALITEAGGKSAGLTTATQTQVQEPPKRDSEDQQQQDTEQPAKKIKLATASILKPLDLTISRNDASSAKQTSSCAEHKQTDEIGRVQIEDADSVRKFVCDWLSVAIKSLDHHQPFSSEINAILNTPSSPSLEKPGVSLEQVVRPEALFAVGECILKCLIPDRVVKPEPDGQKSCGVGEAVQCAKDMIEESQRALLKMQELLSSAQTATYDTLCKIQKAQEYCLTSFQGLCDGMNRISAAENAGLRTNGKENKI